jgi:photosystem II stability/assembly factor-like uncharacterized protein
MLRGGEQSLALSEDGGESWRNLPLLLDPEQVTALAFAPDRPGRVYAVLRDQGLLHSENGGRIWESIDLGFHPAGEGIRLTGLALESVDRLYLITDRGLLIGENEGQFWHWEGGALTQPAKLNQLLAFHGGHLGPSWLPRFWEFLGWGLLGLIASGMLLFNSGARATRAGGESRDS